MQQAAGMVGKFVEYPFDTVKVRLQSQADHAPLRYAGSLDCFRQSTQLHGFWGLYRGVSTPILGAAFETSSLFFFENLGRQSVYYTGWCARSEPLPLAALWYSGAFSGAFTSFVLTPIELVKCRMQVSMTNTAFVGVSQPHTIPYVMRIVYKRDGILGFWRGQMGTFVREVGGSAAWFGAKETTTKLLHMWNEGKLSQNEKAMMPPEPLPIWQQGIAGASAGISYNFLFFPADTVKSRMQTSSVKELMQKTFWEEARTLWRHHGLPGFYRGCWITVIRSAITSALIFIIHDELKRQWQQV